MIFTKNGRRYMLIERPWVPRTSLYVQGLGGLWCMCIFNVETSGILPV